MKKILKSVILWFFQIIEKRIIVEDYLNHNNLYSLEDMPIPDDVFFCKDNYNENLFFKDLREIYDRNDDDQLISLLKKRLDAILIDQVKLNPIDSPFPLAIMACIGIETLGQISIRKKNDELSKQFVDTLKKFDTAFGRSLEPSFETKMKELWNYNDGILTVDSFARLIYTFFRNTMIHGYYGRGVYLSNEGTNSFMPVTEGYLVINPGWLWDKFKQIYNEVFTIMITNPQSNERRNCLKYIKQLLDK